MKQLNLYWLGKLDAFEATIAVTYPSGATCTCFNTSTGEEYTAVANPYTFSVHNAVTYTIRVTLDGVTKDSSVTITTNGQSESLTVSYGTINLTYTSDFQGVSLTCTDGTTTITKTAPSAGTTMAFYPPNTGSWTISGSVSGQSYSTTAVISSLSTPVSATLQTVPDGSTVLPTDDIQTWLACAGITNKSYTTLAEVLADSTTLSALMASNNAVDYMVRSTTWAVSISVPTMTSNTAPSGVCSASSNYSADYPAFRVFDGIPYTSSNNSRWVSASGSNTNQWLQYKFTSAVKIEYVRIQQLNTSGTGTPKNMKVQASNDGVAWTDIATYVNTDITFDVEILVSIETSYQYYRLVMVDTVQTSPTYIQLTGLNFYSASITTNSTAMSYVGLNNYCANTLLADSTWCEAICNSEYFESVLNVKVPDMTSNTTPSGVVSASSIYTSDYPAWKAFNGNWNSGLWASGNGSGSEWLQYEFPQNMTAKYVVFYVPSASSGRFIKEYEIAGSVDGITFTTLSSDTLPNDTSGVITRFNAYIPTNINQYRYMRFVAKSSYYSAGGGTRKALNELQFYGREDV